MVDDSAFVRRALTRVLDAPPAITSWARPPSGAEALERIPAPDPDLVTLDSRCRGWTACSVLRALLRWNPTLRVLMLSAHTREGAAATVEALSAGAVDFIDKSSFNVMDLESLRREVVEKMDAWRPSGQGAPQRGAHAGRARAVRRGALRALRDRGLDRRAGGAPAPGGAARPPPFPLPIVVVQHMPVGFTRPFADRLRAALPAGRGARRWKASG